MNAKTILAGALPGVIAGCGGALPAQARPGLSDEGQRKYALTPSDISSRQSEAMCTCAATRLENEYGEEITPMLADAFKAWNQSIAAGVDPSRGPEGHERAAPYVMPFSRMVPGCAMMPAKAKKEPA